MDDWKLKNYVISNSRHEELLTQQIKEILDSHKMVKH